MLSSFSIISLIGVMLGVLVLVVVMAVYAGMERSVKERLLGYMPHVLLTEKFPETIDGRMSDWTDIAEKAGKLPHVVSATAFVSDFVMVDVENVGQRPAMFRGIDTSDPGQVEGVTRMLDQKGYPGSSADLGLDDRVVISSLVAEGFHLGVGDTLRLVSTKNIKEILGAYKATDEPPLREEYAEAWKKATSQVRDGWVVAGDQFELPLAAYREAYTALLSIYEEGTEKNTIREVEHGLLEDLLRTMDQAEQTETMFVFDAPTKEQVEEAITALETTDVEQMNNDAFKGMKNAVLPRDVVVAGVYQASQMAVTPDLFVPLPLAQNLAGLDGAVQGIALRLDDPYDSEDFAAKLRAESPEWSLVTWGEQNEQFFILIEQQRAMMYFMLSFIILISAFSMMAVMFTVTIQKRREIGVMKALGAASSQIVQVFLYQGMILGVVGAILGVGLGRVVIHFRGELQAVLRTMGFDPFTASFTGFTVLPAYNNPGEQVVFALMAFVLCSFAAFVPAFFAARSDAAKSLRNL